MSDQRVTEILYLPPDTDAQAYATRGGLGLVLDGKAIVWGDVVCTPRSRPAASEIHQAAVSALRKELVGRTLSDIDVTEGVSARLQSAVTSVPGLRLGLDQAVIMAQAESSLVAPADVLADILATEVKSPESLPRLILEADNDVASADVIHHMVGLSSGAVGYRLARGNVAEAIGDQAQHLQRFVRELATLLIGQSATDSPVIYLGLHGALGALTDDPWRQLGQVFGNCAGLESAAGAATVWTEDPVTLEDEVLNNAALSRLREFLRLRDMRTRVIARLGSNSRDYLHMLCTSDAVDGICFTVDEGGGVMDLAEAIRVARDNERLAIVAAGSERSGNQIELLHAVAVATGADAFLVGMGSGSGGAASDLKALRERQRVWQVFHAGRDKNGQDMSE